MRSSRTVTIILLALIIAMGCTEDGAPSDGTPALTPSAVPESSETFPTVSAGASAEEPVTEADALKKVEGADEAVGGCRFDNECESVCDGSVQWSQGCDPATNTCTRTIDRDCTTESFTAKTKYGDSFNVPNTCKSGACARDDVAVRAAIQIRANEVTKEFKEVQAAQDDLNILYQRSVRICLSTYSDVVSKLIIDTAMMLKGPPTKMMALITGNTQNLINAIAGKVVDGPTSGADPQGTVATWCKLEEQIKNVEQSLLDRKRKAIMDRKRALDKLLTPFDDVDPETKEWTIEMGDERLVCTRVFYDTGVPSLEYCRIHPPSDPTVRTRRTRKPPFHRLWRKYYKDGTVETEGAHNRGKRDGPWFEYYESGALKELSFHIDGEVQTKKTFYEDGNPKEDEQYVNGNVTVSIYYVSDGSRWESFYSYADGLTFKLEMRYYASGKIKSITPTVDGKLDGETIGYNEKGLVSGRSTFDNGRTIEQVFYTYDENGMLIDEQVSRNE